MSKKFKNFKRKKFKFEDIHPFIQDQQDSIDELKQVLSNERKIIETRRVLFRNYISSLNSNKPNSPSFPFKSFWHFHEPFPLINLILRSSKTGRKKQVVHRFRTYPPFNYRHKLNSRQTRSFVDDDDDDDYKGKYSIRGELFVKRKVKFKDKRRLSIFTDSPSLSSPRFDQRPYYYPFKFPQNTPKFLSTYLNMRGLLNAKTKTYWGAQDCLERAIIPFLWNYKRAFFDAFNKICWSENILIPYFRQQALKFNPFLDLNQLPMQFGIHLSSSMLSDKPNLQGLRNTPMHYLKPSFGFLDISYIDRSFSVIYTTDIQNDFKFKKNKQSNRNYVIKKLQKSANAAEMGLVKKCQRFLFFGRVFSYFSSGKSFLETPQKYTYKVHKKNKNFSRRPISTSSKPSSVSSNKFRKKKRHKKSKF